MTAIDIETIKAYHQKRDAEKRAQREAERQQWLERVREIVPRVAAQFPEIEQVVLFGSIIQPGRFRPDSDIDVAVAYDFTTLEGVSAESAFWRALEQELRRNVDVRPLRDVIAEIAASQGEEVYSCKDAHRESPIS